MGILDGFLGKSSTRGQSNTDSSKESAVREEAAPPSSELHLPSTSAAGPDLAVRDLSSQAVSAAANSFSSGGMSSGRLYDPYEGLSNSVGVKKSQAAFRLPERPEFVFEEEAAVRRRGWTENLQFYTGLGYISGATSGVAAGGWKFISTKPEVAVESMKLKTNRFLNSAGSFARPYGNGCAMLGLFFSSIESLLISQLDKYGIPETICTVAAAGTSGALFRAPRGPRQALVAGAVGAVGGGGITVLRQFFPAL